MTHPLGGSLTRLQSLPVFGGSAFARKGGLCLSQNHRDRRSQFMRGVRRELGLPVKGGLQLVESCVQQLGQMSQLAVGIRHVDPFGQGAGSYFLCGSANILNGLNGSRGYPPTARCPNSNTTPPTAMCTHA